MSQLYLVSPGYYCIRPIYNLYGMGLGASKVWLDTDDNSEVMNRQHPGSFYCEWFDGPHYSIDYEWNKGWKSYMLHKDIIVVKIQLGGIEYQDRFILSFNTLADTNVLNIEKDSKIIEVHLRLGNLAGDWYGLEDAQTIIPFGKILQKNL